MKDSTSCPWNSTFMNRISFFSYVLHLERKFGKSSPTTVPPEPVPDALYIPVTSVYVLRAALNLPLRNAAVRTA